jgi:hypothetical protein
MKHESLQPDHHSTEQPHFDEEWTLLTARPVVPLEEVKTKKRKSRLIRLIGLFGAALLLGAVSALVVVSFERFQAVKPALVEAANEEPSLPTPEEEVVATSETNVPEASESPEVPPTVAPKTVAVVHSKTKAAERRVEEAPATGQNDSEVDEDTALREQSRAILFDEMRGRWEERRARRIRRLERRERSGRGRDLRRIDEIFEGRRPE